MFVFRSSGNERIGCHLILCCRIGKSTTKIRGEFLFCFLCNCCEVLEGNCKMGNFVVTAVGLHLVKNPGRLLGTEVGAEVGTEVLIKVEVEVWIACRLSGCIINDVDGADMHLLLKRDEI